MTAIAEYAKSKDLFINLTLRELRSKYKRSILGWTWSLINPLTYMVIYTVVFRFFLKVKIAQGHPSGLSVWALYLLCGLLPWNFLQTGVTASVGSLVGGANLIKKSYFPRALLPISAVASALVSHLIEMGLLLVGLVAFGNFRALILLPIALLLMVLNAILAVGLGLLLSSLNVYFRDIEHFITIGFLVWFFGTPIVYTFASVGHSTVQLLKLNPMTDAVLCFRAVLYDGTTPSWLEFSAFALSAFVALAVGWTVFNRLEGRLAEEL